MKVAALFVDAAGPYIDREDVDPWTEERDARLYAGPHPVVAHPPCARWGSMWWAAQNAERKRGGDATRAPGLGDDGGCFAAALRSVRCWGGVIEHPERSRAWGVFGLPMPEHGAGWQRSLFDDGWSCSVDQGRYGHKTRKRTWLYYSGEAPPLELDWGEARDSGEGPLYMIAANFQHPRCIRARAAGRRLVVLRGQEAARTPEAFVDALLALARRSGGPGAACL